MHRRFCSDRFERHILLAIIILLCIASWSVSAQDRFASDVRPLLEKYCFECHDAEKHKGDVILSRFSKQTDLAGDQPLWLDVITELRGYLMPPAKAKQPSEGERSLILQRLAESMDHIDASAPRSPGHAPIHRLNRAEYNNTIRDLFGIDFQLADALPADDTAHGFDNVVEALSLPPLLMEKYLGAAEDIVPKVLPDSAVAPISGDFHVANWTNARVTNGSVELKLETEISTNFQSPAAGEFEVEIVASQVGSPDEPATLILKIDGVDTHVWSLRDETKSELLTTRIPIGSGARRIALRHTWYMELPKDKKAPPVVLRLERVELRGPALSVARQKLLNPARGDESASGARAILDAFGTNVFRRPVSPNEIAPHLKLYDGARAAGKTHIEALRLPFVSMLISPQFLFRIESSRGPKDSAGAIMVSNFELANRLSYFLWSSMPDRELFELAGTGKLHEPATLKAQVARMIADTKSASFIENFAGQWLGLRRFESAMPDPELFPNFKAGLRGAVAAEPLGFFRQIVDENRSILEFLNSDWTILNEELARHYGIRNVAGGYMRKVSLETNSVRGGVVTMAAVLTATSHPTRTSAVKRGKWALDELLGASPPPPPPNVPELEVPKKGQRAARSLRERMELHREDPKCLGCHIRMDAFGLALENFDAIGRWRDKDGDLTIDASVQLPGGEKFNGPAEMKQMLLSHKDEFVRAFAEKMFVYAMGRGPQPGDRREIKEIVKAVEQNQYRFSALVNAIVASYPFQYRMPNNQEQQ